MITWQSDFSETAGTPVQDCGSPAGFWTNTAAASLQWETDGTGLLVADYANGEAVGDTIYHTAQSADQSIELVTTRNSNTAKKPQCALRSTQASSASTTQRDGCYALLYSGTSWRIYYGWSLKGQVADAGYADGTDDPDGDETRHVAFSFVGSTLTLAVTKGGGTVVGTATVEDAYAITNPGNVVLLLAGAYVSDGNLAGFSDLDSLAVEDGVGGGSNVATVAIDVADIIAAILADANAANVATATLAVDDIDLSITATLVEQGLTIHTMLDFSDAADLGHDSSGNGNDWTLTGASQSGDTPTNNFAVLNPVQGDTYTYPRGALSDGNLSWKATSVTSNWNVFSWTAARFPIYFEVSSGEILYGGFGVMGEQFSNIGAYLVGGFLGSWGFRAEATAVDKYVDGGRIAGWSSLVIANGDVIGIAVDPVNGKMWISVNGVWLVGDPATGASPAVEFTPQGVLPGVSAWPSKTITANFGATGFTYAPPAGFSALCAANMPDDTYDTAGAYLGNGNADGPCVFTGCALESVTIGGATYDNDGTPGAVVMFTSCGFKLLSATQNAGGTTYNWTGVPLYPAKYSNAQ